MYAYSKRHDLNVRCCDFLYVFIFVMTLPICGTLAEMCVVKTIKNKQNNASSDHTQPEILRSISSLTIFFVVYEFCFYKVDEKILCLCFVHLRHYFSQKGISR